MNYGTKVRQLHQPLSKVEAEPGTPLASNSGPCLLQGVRDPNKNLEVWTKGILQGRQNIEFFEGK